MYFLPRAVGASTNVKREGGEVVTLFTEYLMKVFFHTITIISFTLILLKSLLSIASLNAETKLIPFNLCLLLLSSSQESFALSGEGKKERCCPPDSQNPT